MGHLSVFDAARLKKMLAQAGLVAHHVEPVANTWTFVVASKSSAPSDRVRHARNRPPIYVSRPLLDDTVFRDVASADLKAVASASTTFALAPTGKTRVEGVISHDGDGDGGRGVGVQFGGMTFDVGSLTALRIQIALTEGAAVRRVFVDLFDGATRVDPWSWTPTKGQRGQRGARRFSFRRGDVGAHFALAEHTPDTAVTRVEVTAEVEPDRPAAFTLRAAYLP